MSAQKLGPDPRWQSLATSNGRREARRVQEHQSKQAGRAESLCRENVGVSVNASASLTSQALHRKRLKPSTVRFVDLCELTADVAKVKKSIQREYNHHSGRAPFYNILENVQRNTCEPNH